MKPESLSFQLINTNAEYIEFVVYYEMAGEHWSIDGIGWMHEGKPSYYLRLLRLNKALAEDSFYKRALIAKKGQSYMFKNKDLQELTLSNISQIFDPTAKKY